MNAPLTEPRLSRGEKQMLKIVAYSVLLTASALALCVERGWNIKETYERLQGPLFTGFLTIGGFLLTLKVFVLVQLREKLFETEKYREIFELNKSLDPSLELYEPLKELGRFLLYCVFASLFTSFIQVTVGFLHLTVSSIICLCAALTTLALVFRAWLAVRRTLLTWFSTLKE
jgi:hypothetical protein